MKKAKDEGSWERRRQSRGRDIKDEDRAGVQKENKRERKTTKKFEEKKETEEEGD